MKKNKLMLIVWIIAVILEWINIILFMAAKSYAINIPVFLALSSWEYIDTLFYICAAIDLILFGLFAIKYRKEQRAKDTLIATFCCLAQLLLIISNLLSRAWWYFI